VCRGCDKVRSVATCAILVARSGGPSPAPRTVFELLSNFLTFARLSLRSRVDLAAQNVFLRKQLALYLERQVKPRRADPATRVILVLFARFID
jgi:hypothetical protein